VGDKMNDTVERPKIKIVDDNKIRLKIVKMLESRNKILASQWAIGNAVRVLRVIGFDVDTNDLIKRGIEYNRLCNENSLSIYEMRQMGFEIHRYAKAEKDKILESALRAFGHAVSIAHMKKHAIVSSDYIIKTLNLQHQNDFDIASKERLLQLEQFKLLK